MTRKLALAVLVLALLGAVAWFAGGEGPRRSAASVAPVAEPPVALEEDAALRPASAVAEPEAARAPASLDETPMTDVEPATADGAPYAIEVVDAATGRPVPDAEAFLVRGARAFSALSFDGWLERGTGETADDAGVVRFHWKPEEPLLVLALSGERSGGAWFAAGTLKARERVELHPDWDVEVRVVDAAGAAVAEVPIQLGTVRQGHEVQSLRGTDEAGRAVLAHAGLEHALDPLEAIVARVQLPFRERLEQTVDPARPPREPLVFTLPAAGSVVVTILDADRRAVPDGTEVQLELVWPGEPRERSAFSEVRRVGIDTTTREGVARFPHVPLGAEVALSIASPGGVGTSDAYFPGPGRAGEVVERTIALEPEHPRLEFRAVDAQGEPLGGLALAFELHETRALIGAARWDGRSELDGRFTVELRGDFEEGDGRILLVRGRGGDVGARVDLSRAFEPGIVPMGDLVLGPGPVLVSGTVEDGSGAPVPGAKVTLRTPWNEARGLDGVPITGWNVSGLEATSGEDGGFVFQAWRAAARLRLEAGTPDARSELVDVDAGDRDVRLLLRRTGAIAGRLEVGPDVPPEELRLRVSPVDPDGSLEQVRWEASRPIADDGTFSADGLLPGRRTVAVSTTRNTLVLAAVADVFVASGETTHDPRLEPLDLRGAVHRFRVVVIPPGPVEDLRGNLRAWSPGDPDEAVGIGLRDGVFEGIVPWALVDASLSVGGYRSVSLEGLAGDTEVRLEPALEVRLALPPDVALPAPPLRLKAALQVPGSGGVHWGADLFDENREVTVFAPGTGALEVVWLVEKRLDGGGAMATTLNVEPVQTVEVLEASGQRFELDVDRATLAEALARSSL